MMRKLGKFGVFLEMIKIEHTIFALPFAFMGALLGAVVMEDRLPQWSEIGWILLAMVGARSAAMGLNRVIDRAIDARNPRTEKRAIPAGLLKVGEVILFIVVSFVLLFVAASNLDPICIVLMPIAVFFLVFYSYTKRFTWLCHVVLGLTIGLAPLGAWVAVTGEFGTAAWLLYISNVFWLAGFDIIYACQDYEFDSREGVHSIPARFGLNGALKLARFFHIITAVCLFLLFWVTNLSWIYLIAIIVAAACLFYEHWIVKPNDISRVQTAFFTMNGALSTVVLIGTFFDLVVLHKW
ncbi:4-hydroxybenzoate polyprenyltransferase [Paenibacillus phyllosphaerae]|uniref:4-hydroxybenzoate polyprenyltransferase n=1 Tax=Paenibacillus phyllosphaerae TaxID=274593 RepID=A0A7W5AW89_9BACL|nr:UbiA-like polyprenyltransferase [Paenibacillus phyllosphaerae]MBB3109281.1 4-hydroxybenzoate polyprenyltransferase [Paenibacillus phyllosphaerae]